MSAEDAAFTLLRQRRFPAPRYALVRGVGESTGGIPGRRCDGIAMSCWPRDRFRIHGCEVKASRNDWLRELRQPDKAEAIQRYCDHWWLVVPDMRICYEAEVPERWGIMLADFVNRRVTTIRKAPLLQPLPVSRQFLAALLRASAA